MEEHEYSYKKFAKMRPLDLSFSRYKKKNMQNKIGDIATLAKLLTINVTDIGVLLLKHNNNKI